MSTHWDQIVRGKLERVLGERTGHELMSEVLREIGLERLSSVADLRVFATSLSKRPGFAAALGGLLSLQATIHESSR